MAIEEFLAVFRGDIRPLAGSIREAQAKLGELEAQAEKTHKSILGMGAKLAVGGALIGVAGLLYEGVKAANEDAVAMAKLNTAFKDAGGKWTPELNKQLEETQKRMRGLGYDNAATLDSVSRLVTAGVPLNDALEKQGQVADYARLKNMDLGDATRQLILATQGNMRATKDLGIEGEVAGASAKQLANAQKKLTETQAKYTEAVKAHGAGSKEAAKAQEALSKAHAAYDQAVVDSQNHMVKFDDLMDQINKKAAGQAEAYRHTLPGALDALKSSFKDMAAKLGTAVTPAILWLSDKLQDLLAWVNGHQKEIGDFASKGMGALAEAGSIVKDIFTALMPVLGFLGDHFAALSRIVEVVTGVIIVRWTLAKIKAIASWVETSVMAAYHAAKTLAVWVATTIRTVIAWTATAVKTVAQFVIMSAGALVNAVKTSAVWIASAVQVLAFWITTAAKMVVQFVVMSAGAVKEAVVSSAAWIASAADTLAAWVATAAEAAVQFAVMSAKAVASAVASGAAWLAEKVAYLAGMAVRVAVSLAGYATIAAAAVASAAAAIAAWLLAAAPIIAIAALWVGVAALIITHWDWVKNHIADTLGILLALITGGMSLLVAFIIDHWSQIRDFVGGVFGRIGNVARGVFDWMKGAVSSVAGTLKDIWNGVGRDFKAVWDGIASVFKGVVNTIIEGIDIIIRGLNNLHIHIPEIGIGPVHTPSADISLPHINEIPKLHSGGIVPGLPGTDVLALLQAGEGVFSRDAMARAMNAMNGAVGSGVQATRQALGAAGNAGTTVGPIYITNPRSELDVVSSFERGLWLDKFNARRIAPPAFWPGEMEPA